MTTTNGKSKAPAKKTTRRKRAPAKKKAEETAVNVFKIDQSQFKDQQFAMRIKEFRTMQAKELMDNTGNWRMHPIFQREALLGGLQQIGITDIIKAYHSPREGNKLVIVDGHLRSSMDPDQFWVVAILDLSDEEADLQLALHDSIGEMAITNDEKLDNLLASAKFENERMQKAVIRIRESVAEGADIARKLREPEIEKRESEASKMQKALSEMKGRSVKVVVALGDDIGIFEGAMKHTKLKNRSDALLAICQYYLDNKEDVDDGV